MIGLFGASYTVISAFKNLFDKYVDAVWNETQRRIEELTPLNLPDNLRHGHCIRGRIQRAKYCWIASHYIVIIAFWFFAFGMAGWAIANWDDLGHKQVPAGCRTVLIWVIVINLLCSTFAIFSLLTLRSQNSAMKTHCKCAHEKQLKEQIFSPDPPRSAKS